MRTSTIALAACLMLVASANADVIDNASFEESGDWQAATGWTVTKDWTEGQRASAKVHDGAARTGEFSLRFDAFEIDTAMRTITVSQEVDLATAGMAAGDEYTFSAWLRGWRELPQFYLHIQWQDAEGASIVKHETAKFTELPTDDWVLAELKDVVPEGAVFAELRLLGAMHPHAKRGFYVDDVSFVPEPMTVALLGTGGVLVLRRRRGRK